MRTANVKKDNHTLNLLFSSFSFTSCIRFDAPRAASRPPHLRGSAALRAESDDSNDNAIERRRSIDLVGVGGISSSVGGNDDDNSNTSSSCSGFPGPLRRLRAHPRHRRGLQHGRPAQDDARAPYERLQCYDGSGLLSALLAAHFRLGCRDTRR